MVDRALRRSISGKGGAAVTIKRRATERPITSLSPTNRQAMRLPYK